MEDAVLARTLHRQMRALYDVPTDFWRLVLGPTMGFHLGHFTRRTVSLDDAMAETVRAGASAKTYLLIAVNCSATPGTVFSELQGVQPLHTELELETLLRTSGWAICSWRNCTSITLPVWNRWIGNLKRVPLNSEWR